MKIFTIIGARPQFIKASIFSKLLKDNIGLIEEYIIHTGQHYDSNMSEIFFTSLQIPKPAFNLGIGGGSHGANTGMMLIEIEKLFIKEPPDAVIVYGDTDSTLAGALAASKLHIPVLHIEAGLRSFNKRMPEEQNRIITDNLSTLLFAPTETAVQNLYKEGFDKNSVFLVGDVMYDATLYFRKFAAENENEVLNRFKLKKFEYHLLTIHRKENTDDPILLQEILAAFGVKNVPVVLPLHPRTRKKIDDYSILLPDNIIIIEPVGYLEMLTLLKNAKFVFTDSGGVQKEAYFLGRPCFTLRNETEWIELVECGANILTKPSDIKQYLHGCIERNEIVYDKFLYGGGQASNSILNVIKQYFQL